MFTFFVRYLLSWFLKWHCINRKLLEQETALNLLTGNFPAEDWELVVRFSHSFSWAVHVTLLWCAHFHVIILLQNYSYFFVSVNLSFIMFYSRFSFRYFLCLGDHAWFEAISMLISSYDVQCRCINNSPWVSINVADVFAVAISFIWGLYMYILLLIY